MNVFYSLGVQLYALGVRLASIRNSKARKWIKGRRVVWEQLQTFEPGNHVVWFHCASLGEFEQGRPLMEEIKALKCCQLVVTFFSPSGYEVKKDYPGADLIVYLPIDSARNAKKFLDQIKPSHAFFIKYEFWAHYIFNCRRRSIPVYSIAALFREEQSFFKFYGGFMRKVLRAFTKIFVQNESSQKLLKGINIESIICGDTRYDRVLRNAESVIHYEDIRQFCGGHKVLVCGSIWPEDLDVIARKVSHLEDWKIIVAPHELSDRFFAQIESSIRLGSLRYSEMEKYTSQQMLIIDNVGMLMNLYQYGTISYIGGGFKTGLHNILEPAAFGLPVIFGKRFEKFPEAIEFIENSIGFAISSSETFYEIFDVVEKEISSERVKEFMRSKRGATQLILTELTA